MKLKPKPAPPLSLLDRRITELNLDGMPLDEALDELGKAAGVKIVLDRAIFRDWSVWKTPVHAHLFDVRLGVAIPICADPIKVSLQSDGTTVRVMAAALPMIVKGYDLRDIVDHILAGRFGPGRDEMFRPSGSQTFSPPGVHGFSAREELTNTLAEQILEAALIDGPGTSRRIYESDFRVHDGRVILWAPVATHARYAAILQRIRETDRVRPWAPTP